MTETITDPLAQTILRVLNTGDSSVDEIHNLCGLPAATIRLTLYRLLKQGRVEVVGTKPATNARGKTVGGPPANVWGAL